jgi:glyoxylase-like metal-dependent hydrolase (beta-lactamase superfamily II)
VVWFPEEQLLFGGCLVKAMDANEIKGVADSDLAGWLPAVRRLQERYPETLWVVPGHGNCGGPELLQHTAILLEQL